MMGIKERDFQPLPNISLEELVPSRHFYRHLESKLDLSFVRDLARDKRRTRTLLCMVLGTVVIDVLLRLITG